MKTILYYVYDPMCVWCYAFADVWHKVLQKLPSGINVRYVLGGLAPDTNEIMPIKTREYVQRNWHKTKEHVPDIVLNFDFWQKNTPRRATYPACRAAVLARAENKEQAMLAAIQRAYYQTAKNPSDDKVLADIASGITSLANDKAEFIIRLNDKKTKELLMADINFARSIRVNSFPTLVLQKGSEFFHIAHSYSNADIVVVAINEYL